MFRLVVAGMLDPKKAAKVSSCKLLATFGHNKFRRFIVLGRARTGSNLLLSFLNSHPNIYAEGEILCNLHGRDHKDIIAKTFNKQAFFVQAKGCKIFYYHPMDEDSSDALDDLASMDDLYIIHLKRRNILRTLVSNKFLSMSGKWAEKIHWGSSLKINRGGGGATCRFTVEELIKNFNQVKAQEKAGDERFRNHPMLSIYYEELVSHPKQTFREVTDFLGVGYRRPQTNLKKQNTMPLRQAIVNYDELKSAFSGTEWQPFFDE